MGSEVNRRGGRSGADQQQMSERKDTKNLLYAEEMVKRTRMN